MKKKILEYSISFAACAIVSFIVIAIRGAFITKETKEVLKYIIDTLFVVGALCSSFGVLVFLTDAGAFDFIAYGFMRFFSLFKKDPNKVKHKTYYDFQVARAEKPKAEFLYLVLVGLLYIGASLIVLIFWYQY